MSGMSGLCLFILPDEVRIHTPAMVRVFGQGRDVLQRLLLSFCRRRLQASRSKDQKGKKYMNKDVNVRIEKCDDPDTIDILFSASERDEQVEALIKTVSEQLVRKLHVVDGKNQDCIIDESEIISISSQGKKVRILTDSGLYTARRSLQDLEQMISRRKFMRISRYEIVNASRIRTFDFNIRGTLRIEFEGGIETWASRRYIPLIKKHLQGKDGAE